MLRLLKLRLQFSQSLVNLWVLDQGRLRPLMTLIVEHRCSQLVKSRLESRQRTLDTLVLVLSMFLNEARKFAGARLEAQTCIKLWFIAFGWHNALHFAKGEALLAKCVLDCEKRRLNYLWNIAPLCLISSQDLVQFIWHVLLGLVVLWDRLQSPPAIHRLRLITASCSL